MSAEYIPNTHQESLATQIVDCAFKVHSTLGPGLQEPAYEHCFCYELEKRQIPYARQVSFPLVYDGERLPYGVRLDVLIDNQIVCELTSVASLAPVFLAQILTQMKLVDHHLGFLINFNVALIKEGIRRIIR
jgi:GxxExxY protein